MQLQVRPYKCRHVSDAAQSGALVLWLLFVHQCLPNLLHKALTGCMLSLVQNGRALLVANVISADEVRFPARRQRC